MSVRRSDGGVAGGRQTEVVDEFACSGMLRNSLALLHSTVERIFCVIFDIGEDNFSSANTGQIWLKLRGPHHCVQAAKVSSYDLLIPSIFFDLVILNSLNLNDKKNRAPFYFIFIKRYSFFVPLKKSAFFLMIFL